MTRTRRSKGEGTLYKRADGRWYAQITLPSGKRKGFYGKEKADVKRRMREAQTALAKGLTLPDESQSVAEYVQRWLDTELKIRPSTRRTYQYDVDKIVAYFGALPLAKLGPQQVQGFYADLLKTHSATRAHHVHSVLHHALYDAVRLSLIDKNPADLVDAPPQTRREMQTLSEDQANALLRAAEGHRYETLFLLAMRTGMRRGELLALRWPDVDLRHGALVVHASTQRVDRPGERIIIGDTKTANSHRTVKVSPTVVEALRAHQHQQKEARLAATDWQPLDLVFPGRGGSILPPELPSRALDALLRAAGLPDVRFHDLRHTAVTILLARGVQPHTVAKMIGDDVALMLRTYAHVSPAQLEQAASVMDSVFGG
jgi:integrase